MNYLKKNYKHISKKALFTIVLLIGFVFTISAQDISDHAIGIRTGDNGGFSNEISYQHRMSDINRVELGLGFRSNKDVSVWKLSGLYQWVWNIDGGFNWYAGFGAGVGSWSFDSDFDSDLNNDNDGIFVNAAGNIGIEYDFEIPLLISLDFRPEIGIVNDFGDNDLDLDIALGLRYQF